MIAGATRGRGGGALIRHLLSSDHQISRPLEARGLISESFPDQVAEMVAMSAAGRTDRPLYHMHVDPPVGFEDDKIFVRYLQLFEAEFGFENQPRIAVEHEKNGRKHRHYAWSLVGADGRIIDIGHDYARREKISRRIEYEFGMLFTSGRHNRSVMKVLFDEGHVAVVEAMLAAGLGDTERPVAATTPEERHQQERTGLKKKDVEARAFEAWTASDDGEAFAAELKARGLLLAAGDEGPVIVDMAGGVHSLTRTIGKASKQSGGERIKAAVVKARVAVLPLEPVEIVRPLAVNVQIEPIAQPTPGAVLGGRMKERLAGWLKSQKTDRAADAQQAIALHEQFAPTREQKIAERVLQVNLTGDYLHVDNQLHARLNFVAGQFQIRVHELTTPLPIPDKLAAAKAELARRETILRTYVIARKRYNEAWVAHWRHRPSKLNYLKYVRWYNEAVQMDKERRGLGRQLGRLNPAVHNSRTDVLDREAQFEAEIRIRQSAVRELEAKFAMEVEKETRRRQPAIERLRSEAEVLIAAAEIAEQRGMQTADVEEVVELMQEAAEDLRKQQTTVKPETSADDEHAEVEREADEDSFEYRPRM